MIGAPRPADEVFYPCSDGEPMAETEAHLLAMLAVIAMLRLHFRSRPDVFVIGNMFWYWEEGNPLARKAPDVMVAKGVDHRPELRKFFKSWEENAVPCFILELTSASTAKEDREEKFELYQRLGVKEYFLFDPLGEYLPRQLMGYRLMGGRYEELQPGADGTLPSSELAMWLRPEGAELVLTVMRTGKTLVDLPQLAEELEQVRREYGEARDRMRQQIEDERRQAEEARKRADAAEQRAEDERRKAEDARRQLDDQRRRAEELEAELQRLRAQLGQPGPAPGNPPPPDAPA